MKEPKIFDEFVKDIVKDIAREFSIPESEISKEAVEELWSQVPIAKQKEFMQKLEIKGRLK